MEINKDTVEVKVNTQFVRNPYKRKKVCVSGFDASRTTQSHADSCDVNKIVARYQRQGVLPPVERQGQSLDCTYLQSMDLTERINFSREKLDAAGRFMEDKKSELAKLEKEKAELEAKELAEFRAAKAAKEKQSE